MYGKINKKGMSLPLNYIVIALIVLTVAVIVIMGFKGMFSGEAKELNNKIEGLKDSDNDGVPDFMDKCEGKPDDECKTDDGKK